jgi:splicing factor 3B subunit 3
VCTLACDLVADGLLIQIHSKGVSYICLPTTYAHPGVPPPPLTSLVYTNWYSDVSISVGAVGHNIVIVAPSNPC